VLPVFKVPFFMAPPLEGKDGRDGAGRPSARDRRAVRERTPRRVCRRSNVVPRSYFHAAMVPPGAEEPLKTA
jgi:hypothetical protein